MRHQGVAVPGQALGVGEQELGDRILGEELHRAAQPQPRTLGIAQALEPQAPRLVGQGEAAHGARRQVEAALLELRHQLPLLLRHGGFHHGFQGRLVAGIVGEGAPVELLGAGRRLAPDHARQGHQGRGAVGTGELLDGAL